MPDASTTKHYWYPSGPEDTATPRERGVAVLQAFRLYRAAEAAMRRRTRDSMSMGENELLVLRYLIKAQGDGRFVGPTELSRYLGISTASTTALIDRLQKSGHVVRQAHPSDRRSVHVVATDKSDQEVRETLGRMHERMIAAVDGMSADEARIVIDCLGRLQQAVDEVDAHAHDPQAEQANSDRS
ncbi:MarR family winged helix-turn-helix transcriptional regulator [Microbacterium thalli]|uniref:MarR family transcriptional regulator n=1 Tax=Microbacterium thalli TaxID=3027921 RepID=A0ABT5SN01_9MICO|nr:MarR family transcriptional regulator [Microbacterium thalli]MDD7927989.1 MarR family transcriptional regulator [Microbacterium thalli]MDD7963168.1 MarR family transcriptional regulator [Microbacterium thalli]MDN8548134.1 MarR family transcriptional regulator [Microbacterium thalli]